VLDAYSHHRRVFIEVTKTEHEHGGAGWEFGTCLWSPEKSKVGHDLYRLMREIVQGDLVLHVLHSDWAPSEREHRFVGFSYAHGSVEISAVGPPAPGEWAGQAPFYRVPLRDFTSFPTSISTRALIGLFEKELRQDLITHPRRYPFTFYDGGREIRLRQGGYINACTPGLFDILKQALGDQAPPLLPTAGLTDLEPSADREYKETKRLTAERMAFARNPALIRDARLLRGLSCEACDFDFENRYGDLGKDYIECHHVNPLGTRDEPTTRTQVRDVRMLCANCHRMVHRKRPPLPVEELRAGLGLPPRPPIAGLVAR
jgi:hypothetical protein